jgi:hypothetical protein
MEWLITFLTDLAKSILDPLFKRILAWPLWVRALTLVLVLISGAISYGIISVATLWRDAREMVNVHDADHVLDLLTRSDGNRLRDDVQALSSSLNSKLEQKSLKDPVNPWCAAQILVSLPTLKDTNLTGMKDYFLNARISDCHCSSDQACLCWAEYHEYPVPHVVMTSWILMALTRMHLSDSASAAQFLIYAQNADGSWSTYPSSGRVQDDSTYATSLALLALAAFRKEADRNTKHLVNQAITLGVTWLRGSRAHGTASFWLDYPYADDGKLSMSASAFAIHALNHLDPQYESFIGDDWLSHLGALDPEALESSAHPVQLRNLQTYKDSVRYFVVQPMIIATADSFSEGGFANKMNAADWTRLVISHLPSWDADLVSTPYKAAELLVALRSLQGDPPF